MNFEQFDISPSAEHGFSSVSKARRSCGANSCSSMGVASPQAGVELLVASLLLVVRPGAPSSFLFLVGVGRYSCLGITVGRV